MGSCETDCAFAADAEEIERVVPAATFNGIVREDGRIDARNYIGVWTTVNCSATVAIGIAAHLDARRFREFREVSGVVAFAHQWGCCIDAAGEGMQLLRRTLAGYAHHPNFGGILLVGLGCETNEISRLMEGGGLAEREVCRSFTIQDAGSTAEAIEKGIAVVNEMLPRASRVARQPVPASHLVPGLECGGSDGYSGVSANPALGVAADLLVRHGGTAVLSETPGIYGAEHLLTRRAVSATVGRKLLERIKWREDRAARNRGEINNNPTPGNKAGGVTTILEKSLGAVAKGGTMRLEAVYEYAELIDKRSCFIDTPGYDPVSVTGLVAGGVNVVCFTTGRGSAYGVCSSPSLKLGTNMALWKRQQEDIDLNCGTILDGDASVEEIGEEIFQMILRTASGEKTKSEIDGYGQDEFAPWLVGAVM